MEYATDLLLIKFVQIFVTFFEAHDSSILEIVKIVKNPSPGHLNRQIILLLSTLGIKDNVFITLHAQILIQL